MEKENKDILKQLQEVVQKMETEFDGRDYEKEKSNQEKAIQMVKTCIENDSSILICTEEGETVMNGSVPMLLQFAINSIRHLSNSSNGHFDTLIKSMLKCEIDRIDKK